MKSFESIGLNRGGRVCFRRSGQHLAHVVDNVRPRYLDGIQHIADIAQVSCDSLDTVAQVGQPRRIRNTTEDNRFLSFLQQQPHDLRSHQTSSPSDQTRQKVFPLNKEAPFLGPLLIDC